MKIYCGVDIGGTNIVVGFFDEKINLINSVEYPTPNKDVESKIPESISTAIFDYFKVNNLKVKNLLGVGISIPGPVKEKKILKTPNIDLPKGYDMIKELQKFLPKTNITLANDANLAAYGEYKIRGNEHKNVIVLTLGTGVGGGIIINGEIIEGMHGCAGELGHIIVGNQENRPCGCGQSGCLETHSGGVGLINYAKEVLKDADSILDLNNLSVKKIIYAAKENDSVALMLLNDFINNLVTAIANLAVIIDPDLFVIGGGIAKAGSYLLDKIVFEYKKIARFNLADTPIELAKLGGLAGIYGAAYLTKEKKWSFKILRYSRCYKNRLLLCAIFKKT